MVTDSYGRSITQDPATGVWFLPDGTISGGPPNPNSLFTTYGVNGEKTTAYNDPHAPPPPLPLPNISSPALNPNALNLRTAAPLPSSPLTFDPLLSPANILQQGQDALAAAKAPVDPTKFIVPGAMDLLTKGVEHQANVAHASAQSDFAARGLTGSSTEVQTLTRDLPAQTQVALQEGTVKLLQAAYPLALADKQNIVDATYKSASLGLQVRSVIGDENYKNLSLQQQRELANQDTQLKLTLADAEMKFQAGMKQAEFAFTHAENETDRAIAQQQFQYLQSERDRARVDGYMKSLISLAATGIIFSSNPAAGATVMAGQAVQTAGEPAQSEQVASAPKFSDGFLLS